VLRGANASHRSQHLSAQLLILPLQIKHRH
jgi:hypothetical protein